MGVNNADEGKSNPKSVLSMCVRQWLLNSNISDDLYGNDHRYEQTKMIYLWVLMQRRTSDNLKSNLHDNTSQQA